MVIASLPDMMLNWVLFLELEQTKLLIVGFGIFEKVHSRPDIWSFGPTPQKKVVEGSFNFPLLDTFWHFIDIFGHFIIGLSWTELNIVVPESIIKFAFPGKFLQTNRNVTDLLLLLPGFDKLANLNLMIGKGMTF